jgi:ankyrin repeat protein
MGLSRTPLQRAAEIGDFQMVEFFIENHAIVDGKPAFGGGTALQLAAMSGHVGIATLLIEHGADVNHPPARGPGRTAFEAAAEWCRPDVMYLLVQHGAQLDLKVTGDVDV